MSAIHIVREYPHPPELVWRALTDPALVPGWTSTGAGGRLEGFRAEVGTRFRFLAKPRLGWSGVVECVVREARPGTLLRYSWQDGAGGAVTEVRYLVEPRPGGARLTYDHVGFSGIGGAFMAWLLGRVRRRMLSVGLPPVLAELGASPAA